MSIDQPSARARVVTAAAILPTQVRFGALTNTGAGGYPVSGSITSGNSLGHWQVVSSLLCPTATGVTAGLNAGPYTLVIGGVSYVVSIDANAYDVAAQAEYNAVAVLGTALSGKHIYIRPGITLDLKFDGAYFQHIAMTAPGVVIESRDLTKANRPTISASVTINTPYITLRGLNWAPSIYSKVVIATASGSNPDYFTLDQCVLPGPVNSLGIAGDYTAGWSSFGAYQAIGWDGNTSTVNADYGTITNCEFPWVKEAILMPVGAGWVFSGNLIGPYWEWAAQLIYPVNDADPNITICDNVAFNPLAKSSYAGNPHPDGFLLTSRTNATTNFTATFHRNRMYRGGSVGDLGPLLACRGAASGCEFIVDARNNFWCGANTEGFVIANYKDSVLINNTIVGENQGSSSTPGVYLGSGGGGYGGTGSLTLSRNIWEAAAYPGSPTLTDNVALTHVTAGNSNYAATFVNPASPPASLADILSNWAMKPSGLADLTGTPDAGAVGSGSVSWATNSPGDDGIDLPQVRFGALTKAGAGGYPVSGAIVSGNGLGHWQVVSGLLSPTSTGVTAGLNAGPYTLVIGTVTYGITIDANAYDVISQTEWNTVAALGTSLAGKTIYLRPGTSIDPKIGSTYFSALDFSPGLTVQSRDLTKANRATFTTMVTVNSQHLTIRGVNWNPSTAIKVALGTSSNAGRPHHFTLDQCYLPGVVPAMGLNGAYNTNFASDFANLEAIRWDGGGASPKYNIDYLTITSCEMSWVKVGILVPIGVNAIISGNLIGPYWDWGMQLIYPEVDVDPNTTVEDNVIFNPIAKSTDYGSTPHPDALLFTGRETATTNWTLVESRNRCYRGGSRGDLGPIAHRGMSKVAGNGRVTAITKANPAQITSFTAHGLSAGDLVFINGVLSMTLINGLYKVGSVIDANNITLQTRAGVNVDSTGYSTYVDNTDTVLFKDSGHFFVVTATGNAWVGANTEGFVISNYNNCSLINNTIVGENQGNSSTPGVYIGTGGNGYTASGSLTLTRNIWEIPAYPAGAATLDHNVGLGHVTGTGNSAYAAALVNPAAAPSSLADMTSNWAMKSGGSADLSGIPDAGAIGASAVVWATTSPGDDGANLV